MYPQLYPRNLTGNIARVDIAGGVVRVLYAAGNLRNFLVSDEVRLVAYLEAKGIRYTHRQATPPPPNRMEGCEAGQNAPTQQPGSTKLSEKAQMSLDKVVEQFKTGDLSPICYAVRLQLDPEAPASKWTLSNRVLAYIQTGSLDCRGYHQWQAVGRQVKKGSLSAYILRPRLVKKTNADGEDEQRLIGFAPVAVFSADDTEGDPLPGYTPIKMPPLADLAAKLGIDIDYQPLPPGVYGSYQPLKDEIRLATHDEATFFHELAHAAHNRVEGELKGGQHEEQETIAEFSATVLMELYGIRDHTGNAWHYISLYAADPLVAVTKALATVEKVLAFLLA